MSATIGTHPHDDRPAPAPSPHPGLQQPGLRIEADGLCRVLRDGTVTLTDVSLAIEPGRVVAVIGASGAGKTTLLETLAGLRLPSSGAVAFDGRDVEGHWDAFRTLVGYVPQDDIIHRDLPVRATVRHAARLRLPHLDREQLDGVVDTTLSSLGLTAQAATVVGRLSGGQRKRVSIAVELLMQPRACFLDEPTSGLDPGTARSLMATLRQLAADGSTIVLTTHSPDDVASSDEVIVLGPHGRLAFHGTPQDALTHFEAVDVTGIYASLAEHPTRPAPKAPGPARPNHAVPGTSPLATRPASGPHQWRVLTRRNLEVLTRNRLTLAIMLGAPVLVTAMMVVLFRPHTFDPARGDALAAVGITYWLAFAAFFFGLTYGLLQVCTELAVVRRERHVGLDLGAYLLAKVTVLVPFLLVVIVAMLGALRLTDRIPALGRQATVMVVVVLLLDAIGALALGLLASAAVADPSQATLALPMLCFPAVLFGGAVLPTQAMAVAGQAISAVTADRWAFEALGRALGMGTRFGSGTAASGVAEQHALAGGSGWHLAILVAFALVFLVAGLQILVRRTTVRRPIARQCERPADAAAPIAAPAIAGPAHLGVGPLR